MNDQDVYVHFETELTEDAVSGAFIPAIKQIATEQGGVDEADVEAWVDDFHEGASAGEYFFNYNQYLFVVEKP